MPAFRRGTRAQAAGQVLGRAVGAVAGDQSLANEDLRGDAGLVMVPRGAQRPGQVQQQRGATAGGERIACATLCGRSLWRSSPEVRTAGSGS